MKKLIFLLYFLFLPSVCFGAAFTSKALGNWSASGQTTWNEVGVPASGDTVTLDHAVTVDSNTAIGTSPSDQTTMVITINANGSLTVADGVTLTCLGNIYNNAGASGAPTPGIIVGTGATGGAALVMDATGAGTPTTEYVIKHGSYSIFKARGISANRASISSNAAGGFAATTVEFSERGGCLDFDYVKLSRFGDSNTYGIRSYPQGGSNYCTQSLVKNTTVDTCGAFLQNAKTATSIITIENLLLQNSTGGSLALYLVGVDGSTGRLSLTDSVVNNTTTVSYPEGWSVNRCYLRAFGTTGTTATVGGLEGFEGNFIRNISSSYASFEASMTNSYWVGDFASANFGLLIWENKVGNKSITGSVFEYTDTAGGGDLIFPHGFAGNTFTFANNILLPGSNGGAPGKLISHYWEYATGTATTDGTTAVVGTDTVWSASNILVDDVFFLVSSPETRIPIAVVDAETPFTAITLESAYAASGGAVNYKIDKTVNTSISINNNTIHTAEQVETGIGVCENDLNNPGMITSLKSNLFWTSALADPGYKLVRQESAIKQDIVAAANADYNWGWNLADGSDGNGYNSVTAGNDMFSSGTPDAHGGTGDPQFVDTTRNLATADIALFGNAAATAWADTTAYVVGDIISTASANYYGNAVINYRCVTAHTAAAGHATNGQPGVATNWRTNWEFASLYRLRSDTSKIATLITWVKNGYKPRNQALKTASHTGGYVGAMDVQTVGGAAALMLGM